jgi:hypothetical protein
MYIMLTSRCNMHCDHCCQSCGPRGHDMSLETFKAALKLDDEAVSLGGGEPTLHPLFEQFLLLAIAHCENVWIVTNGKIKERALLIAKLTKHEVIAGELSLDIYHEPIDPEVVEAFGQHRRGIRNTTMNTDPFPAGRAKTVLGIEGYECPCDDTFVRPSGRITQCGCPRSPTIGNVHEGYKYVASGCYRSEEYKLELQEA